MGGHRRVVCVVSTLAALVSTPRIGLGADAANATVPAPAITHEPLRCLRAKEFPRVDAKVTSSAEVKRARVYFKAHQHPDWYYVDMRVAPASSYLALLPQPLPETRKVDYYVQAIDALVQSSQTETFDPAVSHDRCRLSGPKPVPWEWPEKITIGGTKPGQPRVPPGFSAKGLVGFIAAEAAGATALSPGGTAAGSGASPGGGAPAGGAAPATAGAGAASHGVSTAVLLVGGGAAAAGGALALGVGRSSGGTSTSSSDKTATSGGTTPGSNGQTSGSNHAPSLSVSVTPVAGLAGFTEISGVATVQDPDQDPVTCQWDFGDGSAGSGLTVTHVYQQAGTFAVTATASDGRGGSASATRSVSVGSLTGLWHCNNLGQAYVGTDYRCAQSGGSLACHAQDPLSKRPIADGTFRQPMALDFVYHGSTDADGIRYLDVACTGNALAGFSRIDCWGVDAGADYGMDRVGQ